MYRHHSAPMYNYVMKRRICVFSLKGGEQKGGPGWSPSPGIWGKGGYCAARGISWKRQNDVDDHEIIYYMYTCTVYYIRDQKHQKCHNCRGTDSVDLFPPGILGKEGYWDASGRINWKTFVQGGVEKFVEEKNNVVCLKFPEYDDSWWRWDADGVQTSLFAPYKAETSWWEWPPSCWYTALLRRHTYACTQLEPQGFLLLGEGIFKLLLKLATTQNKKPPKKNPLYIYRLDSLANFLWQMAQLLSSL